MLPVLVYMSRISEQTGLLSEKNYKFVDAAVVRTLALTTKRRFCSNSQKEPQRLETPDQGSPPHTAQKKFPLFIG